MALSQKRTPTAPAPAELYRQADSLYYRALALSRSGKNNDAEEERLNRTALGKFAACLNAAAQNKNPPDTVSFFAAVKAGELAHYFDSLPHALAYYNAAIGAKEGLPALSDSLLFKPYALGGLIYVYQNKLDSALAYLKKAEAIGAKAAGPLPESERLYNILGSVYYEYGNYRQAKNYFQKATDVLAKDNPSYKELYVNYRVNVAASLYKLEEYGAADNVYQSLLRQGSYLKNQIYNNLGLIRLYSGTPREAIAYFRKVNYNSNLNVGLYNDMARAYFVLKQFDSARRYLALATSENAKYNAAALSIDYGRSLKLSGDLQSTERQYGKALRLYQEALHHFYPSFTDTDVASNPVSFSGAFSYLNLFQTLAAKAEAMEALYRSEKKGAWANQSLETYKAAFALIAYVERTYESDEARLFLAKIRQALHSKPIDLAFERYQQTGDAAYLSLLYTFDQQNKAAVLALNRQLNTALEGNPSPLVQKERDVKNEITRLSIKASQTADSGQLALLNNGIRDYEIELGKLQQTLYPNGPVKETIPSLRSLQDGLLDKKTALISYHLSSEKLTTLVVTQKDVRCYQQALPSNFTSLVQQEIRSLKTPPARPTGRGATGLSNLLLANVPLTDIDQLIIIPDDVLAYLPFESLQNSGGSFLVQRAAVQYQFSTALLTKNETDFARAETLSFAPFAKQSYTPGLPVLPSSARETEGMRGNRFLDTAATKEKFLAFSRSFPIVHLATHAVVNDSADNFSYIAFAPGKNSRDNLLYAQEIYNLHLQQTGLIILSACETGAGSLVKGEGVLSLSRAFAYAGCPNVIASLWKADDFSTAYLTARIHRYLSEGLSIARAAQKAKLDYLNDKAINPRLKQPYYWSHLVFVGTYEPEKNRRRYWMAAAALLLLSVAVYKATFRKRKR